MTNIIHSDHFWAQLRGQDLCVIMGRSHGKSLIQDIGLGLACFLWWATGRDLLVYNSRRALGGEFTRNNRHKARTRY